MKAVSSPKDAVSLNTTFIPPTQTITPKVIEDNSSAIGKNMELYQTVFNHAFLWRLLIFLKFSLKKIMRVKFQFEIVPLKL